MRIRQEHPGDVPDVSAAHARAFQRPDDPGSIPIEVKLLAQLRESDAWLPALSLVAEADERIVGHVVCTRASVGTIPVLGLGPIGVQPDQQNQGIGTALMEAVISEADGLGEPLIGLVGQPSYYIRFGFVPAIRIGITAPDPGWGAYFQVKTLSAYQPAIRGAFRYAEPFERL